MSDTIRFEEYHLVGGFVMSRFNADKADFIGFSPVYADPFETDANARIESILGVVRARFHINAIMGVTNELKDLSRQALVKLTLLEKYVLLAKADIVLTPKQFGFVDVRDSIHRRDDEAIETDFAFLLQNVTNNLAALMSKGFTLIMQTELEGIYSSIVAKNVEQEGLKSDKRRAVVDYGDLFGGVLDLIKDVQDTGKRLYKFTNKEKTKDYTMSYILKQIRQEQSKKEEANNAVKNACAVNLKITDQHGVALQDVEARILNYNLTLLSDGDGVCLFEAVPTQPVNSVSIRLTGENLQEKTLENQGLIENGQLSIYVIMMPV